MALRSQFGALPPTDFLGPPRPKPKQGHVLHNLLKDAIDTAKGIPFGMVEFARNPVKSVKLMGEYYGDTYGQGWDHFKKEFMAHPLQPLLDAISVPLVFAGGAGFAIKGVSSVANVGKNASLLAKSSKLAANGRWAEADAKRAEAMPYPRLDAAAQRFRRGTTATTRRVSVLERTADGGLVDTGITMERAYSANIFRRFMTKGSDALLEAMIPGRATHLGERMLAKELKGKRPAATAAAGKQQARVLMGAKMATEKAAKRGEEVDFTPTDTYQALGRAFETSLVKNSLLVPVAKVAQLANTKTFRDNFEVIYRKDAVEPSLEKRADFAVGPEGAASTTRAPMVAHPGSPEGVSTRELTMNNYEQKTMLTAIQTIGKRVETGQDMSKALVKDGNVMLVRKGIHEETVKELERTAQMADHVYRSALGAWKGIILGLSPRYFVNNVVGNWLMYVAATNPVEVTRGILTATKDVKGNRAAAREARRMEGTLDGLMSKYMPDEWISSRAGYLQHGALGLEQTAAFGLKTKIRRAGHAKLYSATEKASYRAPQRAALMGVLHTDGDFRNVYRENLRNGMERGAAYRDAADTIFNDRRKAAAFEKRVTDWAGQYYHLNSLEKKITAFVPFYTWDRHALRFGKEQVLSRPVQSVVLAQLGALGDEAAERELGKIPDFMKGAIPLKGHGAGVLGFLLGQNIKGREKIMLTAGYNPLAAAADNAAAIATLFGQSPRDPAEGVGGQVNPIISGFIGGVTGKRLFSGAKAETHGAGPIGGAVHETFVELPHAKLIKGLLGETPPTTTSKGQPTLYEKGMRQTISSILGLNERDFSPEAAERLYNQEKGIKKGRRKKKKDAMTMASQLKSNF